MKKELSYDWYKLRKSKTLKTTLIFSISLGLLLILLDYILWITDGPPWSLRSFLEMSRSDGIAELCVIIFVSYFATKDYSGGYIKNIYKSMNKFNYIFSKYIYSFLFVVVLVVVKMAFALILHLLFANEYIYNPLKDSFTIGEYIVNRLIYIGLLTALSSLIIFLSTIAKKSSIVLIFFLAYLMFLSSAFYSVMNIFMKTGVEFANYTVFGNIQRIYNTMGSVADIKKAVICIVSYSIVSIIGSWVVLKKKSY